MNIILETLNKAGFRFVEFASPMLIQSSILILILLAADFLLRKKVRATFRYWIWMLVLIKLVLPVSLYSPLSLGSWFGEKIEYANLTQEDTGHRMYKSENTIDFKSEIQDFRPIEPRVESSESVTSDTYTIITNPLPASSEQVVIEKPVKLSWQAVIFLIWIAITAALGLVLLKRTVFIKELVTKASDIDIYQNNSISPNDILNHCCIYLGLKKQIPLKISPDATSPVVCGLLRPVILLPQNLITSLSSGHLKAIFFHEIAHIKRGDLWVNLLQTLLQITYFYNPLLWLANSIIRRTREQAVDEMVLVAMGKDAREYPETLLNVAKLAFKRPALSLRLIGVVESEDALTGRIKHMLSRPLPKSAKLGILGLVVIIIAAAILLPMGKKSNVDYFVDTTKGYIRCDSDISELGRILINMSYMYGFKQEFASSTGFGSNESPVKYSTTNYIIPDNKKLSIEAVAEKNQPLIIQIDLEPGAVYSLDEITTELARQLGIFSKATSLINKSETSMSIQLLGVSEHPSENNQWWKPDGSLLKERPYGTIKGDRTFVYNNKENAYEFVVRLDGDNNDIVKWKTEPSDGSYMKSYPETKDNKLQKDLRVLVTRIPTEQKSCDLEINTESWFTLTKVKENQQSYSFGDFTARVIPPKNEDGKYVVRVQETEKEFDNRYKRRYVIKLKDSEKLVNLESFTKQTSYNDGELRLIETIYTLDSGYNPDNIEYVAAQYGFTQTTTFKNVSLAAQHKTNVQTSSLGIGHPSFIYADLNKPPVPRLTELSTGIVKGQKLLFFHSEHPQTLWQRLNKDKQYNPKWYFRVNGDDYPLSISGQLAHSKYEQIEAFSFPFDLKNEDKQWPNGDYSLSVVIKDTVWLDPKGTRHYYKELVTDPIEFKIQDGSFLSKTGQPIPKEKADQKTLEEKSATESASTSQPAPIIGYDVKLNFADPSIRDGSFHSQQRVAFVLSFQQIEGMLAGKGIDFISTGQNIWSVIVDHNSLTISEGNVGQKIITESWPSEDKKFEKVVTLPLEYSGKNYQCPVYIELQPRERDFPIGSYWFCAYISGRLPSGSGGRTFEIVNLDQQMEFRLKGDGTDKRDAVLGIDINGDGKINPSTSSGEQFSLYEPFTIDSKTYRVAEVDPYLPRVVFREVASESKTNTSASGQSVKPKLTIKSHEENGANKEAEALMGKFQQALRDSDWSKALSFCSDNAKSNAAEYESLEKYFTEVVPVEKIKVLTEVIVSGWSGLDNMRGSYQCFLRISEPDSVSALKWEPTISWQWHLNKTDSGWEVDFKQIPLNEWIEQEANRQKNEREQSLERERILKEGLKLTLIPLRDSFVIGKPMEFRFELKNISDSPIEYWSSQFTFFNDPMTIIDPNGSQVNYIAGPVQTGEAPTTIDPNQTIVLEEKYDVTSQYLITSPGAYTFQFTGYGFTVVKSNVVKMEVELGQISNGDLVLQKLIEIAPKDWEITKNKIPDNGISIAMIGDYGRKATPERPTGVILLVNPSKSYLEAIDNEAEFLGHSKWGDVYINSLNAESLWPDYKEQIVQFLRIETAENSIKQNEEKPKSFTTLLPNGGTIELVGVRKKSLPDQPWYSPDGLQKLDSSDEIFSHLISTSGIVNAAGTQTYEFFIHCDLPSNKIGKVVKNSWSFEPEKGIPGAFSTSFQIGQHYFTASSAFPEALNKINLTFSVSNGPWKAIAESDGIKEKEISITHRGQKQNITLGEIIEKDGSVFIEVKHQIKEMAAQVIIFEKNNNVRYPLDNVLDYADPNRNILVTKCKFEGMTKDQIGRYEFQVQPIDIVTFKDVSLKNESHTNPEITTTSITDKTIISDLAIPLVSSTEGTAEGAIGENTEHDINDAPLVVEEATWGQEIEKIQIRARVDQQWYEGQIPKFLMDVRNNGMEDLSLVLAPEWWELELDGIWYKTGTWYSGIVPVMSLDSGEQKNGIEFVPTERWEWNNNRDPLKFLEGTHEVRLLHTIFRKDPNKRSTRVLSNRIKFEILPKEENSDTKVSESGVNIYLLADETIDIDKAKSMPISELVLREEPWISSQDIEIYDASSDCIYLKKERPEFPFKITSVKGSPFVVTANGQKCYTGVIIPAGSSYLPENTIPMIHMTDFILLPSDIIRIQHSPFMSPLEERIEKELNGPFIVQALKDKGQYHEGLRIVLDKVDVSKTETGSSLSYTYTLINKDADDLYVFDPDKMGVGLFHYFNNCPGLLPEGGEKSINADHDKVVKAPDSFDTIDKSWFSLIKSGQKMTRTVTLDAYSEILPGKYECSFMFHSPGPTFTKEKRAQFDQRVWIGQIGVKANIDINDSSSDDNSFSSQVKKVWQLEAVQAIIKTTGRIGISFRIKYNGLADLYYTDPNIVMSYQIKSLTMNDIPMVRNDGINGGLISIWSPTGPTIIRYPNEIDGFEKLKPGTYPVKLKLEGDIYENNKPNNILEHWELEISEEIKLTQIIFGALGIPQNSTDFNNMTIEMSSTKSSKPDEMFERIINDEEIDLNLIYQSLIGPQTALRADSAQYLGTHGDSNSIPYLIDALSDESTHVGRRYSDMGMHTTRYWVNDSLKKLTGLDTGFVWNEPIEKRNKAIQKWKYWWEKNESTFKVINNNDREEIENIVESLWQAVDANDTKKVSQLYYDKIIDNNDSNTNGLIHWLLKDKEQVEKQKGNDIASISNIVIKNNRAIAVTKPNIELFVYYFVKPDDKWFLYYTQRRTNLSKIIDLEPSIAINDLFNDWPRTKLDNEAGSTYLNAGNLLHEGAEREEVAKKFKSIGELYPLTDRGKISTELGKLLDEMVQEDKMFVEPQDIERLSEKEKIDYYIYKLREVAEQEFTVPGKCFVLRYPRTPDSAAVALRNMGPVVVPAMISLLEDNRPTRSVGAAMNGGVVLRYCDIALEIITDIAGQNKPNETTTFDPRTQRGAYLSSADEKNAREIIDRAKSWWEQNKDKYN